MRLLELQTPASTAPGRTGADAAGETRGPVGGRDAAPGDRLITFVCGSRKRVPAAGVHRPCWVSQWRRGGGTAVERVT